MKYMKYAVLFLLLLVALSLCGTAVLWIMGLLFNTSSENLFYDGFRVGLLACALLIVPGLIKKKKKEK